MTDRIIPQTRIVESPRPDGQVFYAVKLIGAHLRYAKVGWIRREWKLDPTAETYAAVNNDDLSNEPYSRSYPCYLSEVQAKKLASFIEKEGIYPSQDYVSWD